MTGAGLRLLPAGDTALTVEFGDAVDPRINARVLSLDRALEAAAIPGVIETVPTYRSLQIHFDPDRLDAAALGPAVVRLAATLDDEPPPGRTWTVPVSYGGEHGIDLEQVAERTGLAAEGVIARHLAGDYRVYMIGFQPGFAYLGGLDARLHLPRRETPRLKTPAGTVSIGGIQAAVASIEAPSGWHLLGRTPVRAFDPARSEPFLFRVGDRVRFERVTADGYTQLARRVADEGWRPRFEDP
ncbi:MAG: 5-oxoprolinase subunit PxpB [Alphaproteobacteria bacterium]|nr:5-oxoprolinase subunit PxpB [Alphaproteobacteria bacterium]